jgi:hypothetical protein
MSQNSTASANDRQVGGSHYKDCISHCPHCGSDIQHWDLFGMLPYLVGYATKEIVRHRSKEGRLGLEKSIHIIDKLLEYTVDTDFGWAYDPHNNIDTMIGKCPQCRKTITFEDFYGPLPYLVGHATKLIMMYWNRSGLQRAKDVIRLIIKQEYGDEEPREETHAPEPPTTTIWVPADKVVIPEPALDTSIEATRARAEAFASAKPNADVPIGWVLEEVHGFSGMWHFRAGKAGNWGAKYSNRETALYALKKHIADLGKS